MRHMSAARPPEGARTAAEGAPASLLTVTGLGKSFGAVKAVDGIGFTLAAGELLALIGPNGAGKSTTFNMINGQLSADTGSIMLDGQPLRGRRPRQIFRLGVGRTFQIAETFASLTVLENVQMALLAHEQRLFSFWRKAADHRRDAALALLDQVGLQPQADRPCHALAYGDIKRVELAMALAHDPRLLLMDEPTAGMAPKERNALMALTRQLVRGRSMAVLFTEHSMDVVFAHADRMIVLARGRLIAEGKPLALREHPEVQRVYFGTGKTFERQAASEPGTSGIPGAGAAASAGAPGEVLLQATGLHAWYGAAQILYDLDLYVRRGEVVALMGRNGAGKSTTLKALMGLLARRSGQIRFMGQDLSRSAPQAAARLGLGYVPEDRRVFTDLTVLENLEVGRQPERRWPDGTAAPAWTPERLFALFPNLGAMPHRPGGRISGGEQQMLTVARTLMGNPLLLLLDEPSEGVAPVIVEQMARMILELKAQGVSILLSEQNMHFAELVSDRAYVLEKGQIRYQASMAELAANEEVRLSCLGV
ncbi:ABC transporter related [Verminephrobacter eiseniae EF01-2]|uniref:ABC transporter related n=1 Tax=Verminephrobacter eiseniae (strain EF01-2) TaxID=391735 RepID=A1WG82_VEREI|nr:ABC transporter related [Verminephrobacter eiseniae EF01-2]